MNNLEGHQCKVLTKRSSHLAKKIRRIYASVRISDVRVKSNQQTKKMMKKNYEPKANDKGKESNAIFFETSPSLLQNKNNTDVPCITCP